MNEHEGEQVREHAEGDLHPAQPLYHRQPLCRVLRHGGRVGGDYRTAAIWILVSSIFDGLDGKVARVTGTSSKFGVEYDSLADLVAFGVAPGLLMYSWALKPFGRLGWLAAFLFVVCGALRLARFNVQVETVESKRFVGLPIPAAASMVSATVLFFHHFGWPSSYQETGDSRPHLSAGLPHGLQFPVLLLQGSRNSSSGSRSVFWCWPSCC